MASDEIINSKSIEYADSRFSNLDVGDYVKFASMSSYSDGYTQGRADAWRWREYPREKPDVSGGEVLVLRKETREYWHDEFVSKTEKRSTKVIDVYTHCEVEHYDEESWGEYSDDVVTHWLPITLPGGEND